MDSNSTFKNAFPEDVIKSQTKAFLSDDVFEIIAKVIGFIQMFFSFLGVLTNTINIRVFVKQGVKNSTTNIAFLFLSIFDLFSCLLLITLQLCFIVDLVWGWLPGVTCDIYCSYSAFIYVVFYYCSNWTTVYLSIEKSLCVLIPLKVKLILRPKVTLCIIVSICIIFLTAQMTYSTSTRIVWGTDPVFNVTRPYITESPFGKQYIYFYSLIANTFLSSFAIIIVAIATAIMVNKLKKFQKWRQNNAAASSSETSSEKKGISSKDAEMVKFVVTVTSIFLVCLSVGHIPATVILVIPGATYSGIQHNVFFLGYHIRFLFSLVNSSINFFFYIRTSTRYKEAFAAAFPKCSCLISTNK